MSIDPDAPTPVSERRPRARRVPPTAREPEPEAVPEAREAKVEAAPEAPVLDSSVAASSPIAASEDLPVPEPPVATPAAEPAPVRAAPRSRSATSRSPGRRPRRGAAKERVEWESALDDPAISADGNGYRSFYVSDEVFARFRAAVYWTARRPDVDGVPDNMSVGVEEYMESVATDLERRFNDRAVFPPTPDQIRAHRKRENKS